MSRFKPLVIALNGPPGIGKGWLANQLTQILPFNSHILSFAEPMKEESMRKDRWTGSYADYKVHVFADGFTGRDHLIALGEGRRKQDINYWSRELTDNRKFSDPNAPIIVIDDLGFYEERAWVVDHADRFMTIVMAPTRYTPGMLWEGDSRVCLHQFADGIRAIDSNAALRIFKERLTNAESYQSSRPEQRTTWFDALLGRLVEQ